MRFSTLSARSPGVITRPSTSNTVSPIGLRYHQRQLPHPKRTGCNPPCGGERHVLESRARTLRSRPGARAMARVADPIAWSVARVADPIAWPGQRPRAFKGNQPVGQAGASQPCSSNGALHIHSRAQEGESRSCDQRSVREDRSLRPTVECTWYEKQSFQFLDYTAEASGSTLAWACIIFSRAAHTYVVVHFDFSTEYRRVNYEYTYKQRCVILRSDQTVRLSRTSPLSSVTHALVAEIVLATGHGVRTIRAQPIPRQRFPSCATRLEEPPALFRWRLASFNCASCWFNSTRIGSK
jgi:hypothetical protein